MKEEKIMKKLPQTQYPLVLRTDFTDPSAWEKARHAILKPFGDYRASVAFIDDVAYRDITQEQLLQIIPDNDHHRFIIVFDYLTVSMPESPLLIVDLYEDPGRTFRAIPSQIFEIQSNLSLANMDFSEFADFVDQDGVYCGYPLRVEDVDPQIDKADFVAILASAPVSKPPKTWDIRQHVRYWITRIALHFYRKKIQE